MEQRKVTQFLISKELNSVTIHFDLILVYKQDMFTPSTVKKWCMCFQQRRINLFDDPRSRTFPPYNLRKTIASILYKKSFLSLKVLPHQLMIAKAICLYILHKDFGVQNSFLLGSTQSRLETESGTGLTFS
jgi:hypothetical protein